ncbi:hypothetical protein [Myxococcus sp. AS-1-15]|uniref:hypothetical protein n=1 Tax=Myxococcus sp. AS-1-15 TaxID=2874600 RepID=UPI001CC1A113|nr:hypothetical protein [Myxococcus sp. AS-1-15]MBZ4396302.1 hypothetical protein [Myxococcus sp. AS-1-15]BDT37812.1 PQQ-binding-like beta-propeller repeat protein [Myxococcus sp. MH1]
MLHGGRGWRVGWGVVVLALACERHELPAPEKDSSVERVTRGPRSTGATRWVRPLTGPGRESAAGLAHDARGEVVVALNSDAAVADFFGPLLNPRTGPVTPETFAVARYGTGGERQWSLSLPGFAEVLAVSARGRVFVVGRNVAGADLGGGPLPAGRFLLELGRDGVFIRARSLEALGVPDTLVPRHADVDGLGNLVLVGSVFDAKRGRVPAAVKLDAKGALLWTYVHEGQGEAVSAAVDAEGQVYVAGALQASRVRGALDSQPFLVKLDARGRARWERRLDTRSGRATGVAVRGQRVLVTGGFTAPLTFLERTCAVEPGGGRGFVAAFDPEGAPRWLRDFGFMGTGLALDEQEGALVVGRYEEGDDLGTGPMAGVAESRMNLFLVKLDRVDGVVQWARGFPREALGDADAVRDFVSLSTKGPGAVLGTQLGPVDLGTGRLAGAWELFLGGFEP